MSDATSTGPTAEGAPGPTGPGNGAPTGSPRPCGSVLVANRGEIARRIFATARSMGMRCIAVFADADADAPFVAEADEAVRLPAGYLDIDALIDAARRTGAEAVHPGYGFLSERAAFAEAVIAAGLVWVGPSPRAIAAMGDKLAAKELAVDAGVPTLPSATDPADAATVGFPLLVKASAGGGGKGMRVVESADDLDEAVAAARREAGASFGDDTVFCERWVPRARHVEIQVLGDRHGTVVSLGERECSVQRRHQKILEESPSPAVDHHLRQAMGDAAVRLAAAIGYESAGTVEFLVDDATREFWFLEMNTRLQVEHPVTELVTGLDLVREQFRIAAGEQLTVDAPVEPAGHAIEVRLYAEDPASGFLPATGTLVAFEPPTEPAVRWDSGVVAGSVVGLDFDPMLAKVIAHAPTRREAAARLASALERLHLGGVTTNRAFLVALLRSDAFLAGDTTTDLLDRVDLAGAAAMASEVVERAAIMATAWRRGRNHAATPVLRDVPAGWRNARLPAESVTWSNGDTTVEVGYRTRRDGSLELVDGRRVIVHTWAPHEVDVEIDGVRRRCRVTALGDRVVVQLATGSVELREMPRFTPPGSTGPTGGLTAPMPGRVLEVRVAVGDTVTAGETLVVLEAMKMEHRIQATTDGTVAAVHVRAGDQVETGASLLELAEPGDA